MLGSDAERIGIHPANCEAEESEASTLTPCLYTTLEAVGKPHAWKPCRTSAHLRTQLVDSRRALGLPGSPSISPARPKDLGCGAFQAPSHKP